MQEVDDEVPPEAPSLGDAVASATNSRRAFIRTALIVGAVGAVAGLGYLALSAASNPAVSTTTSTSRSTASGLSYPSGKRFAIIPTLADYPDGKPYWDLTSYAPQDVISMIQDLQPDTLHRFIQSITSQGLDQNAVVPGSNPAMTVAEFVQASMDASGSIVIPKVTLRTYDSSPSTFLSQAQALLDFNVSPPLTLLSVDEWDAFTAAHGSDSVPLIEEIVDQLRSQGWKGVEIGACGAPEIPSGFTSFSLFCVNPSTWQAELSTLGKLKSIPSNKSFQLSIDYPGPIQAFQALTPDTQEQLITAFASAQKQNGYSFVYPIVLQGQGPAMLNYDSKKVVTSSGSSLYQVMKGLMQEYN